MCITWFGMIGAVEYTLNYSTSAMCVCVHAHIHIYLYTFLFLMHPFVDNSENAHAGSGFCPQWQNALPTKIIVAH